MYLYGASGHAKVIMDILSDLNIKVDAIMDDNMEIHSLLGSPIIHTMKNSSSVIVSIGDNVTRKKIVEKISQLGCVFESAIHPSAIVSKKAFIEKGTVVMQGAIIQSSAKIGKHCIVNTGASVDHECILDDYVHLSPHATLCGNVVVGEGSWIGAGATIIQGVKIGKWCVVGAGAVVTKNLMDRSKVVGVPARFI